MNPYQYMPFGFGPRICIGKRLAITEMKVAIIKLLKEFVVLKCNKTKVNILLLEILMILNMYEGLSKGS